MFVCFIFLCYISVQEVKLSPELSGMDTGDDVAMEISKEFPATNLYELEGRVFTDQWSIPYKKEESLGKCLIASARFAEQSKLNAIGFDLYPSPM